MMDCKVPASSDSKVMLGRNKMYQVFILGGKFCQKFRGAVCRVVVHYYHIVWETAFLTERTFHGILDCPYPVEYRNDHRCCHRIVLAA